MTILVSIIDRGVLSNQLNIVCTLACVHDNMAAKYK